MSDIRFNNWLHQSGTGGVHQDSSGNVGIGTSIPNTILDVRGNINTTGICSASSFIGDITGDITGAVTGNVIGNLTGNVTGTATSAQNLVDPDGSEMITCDAAGIVVTGIATVNGSLEVGDTFIKSTSIGIGTTNTAGRNAGVSTAIGTLVYNAETNAVEAFMGDGSGGASWITVKTSVFSATGGTVTTSGNFTIHTFNGPGSFIAAGGDKNVEYMLVSGGGGGGWYGGGGASAIRYDSSYSVSPGTLEVTIGGGGSAATGYPNKATTGTDSTFGTLSSPAGGGGGSSAFQGTGEGRPGGCGGGGGSDPNASPNSPNSGASATGATGGTAATSPAAGWGNAGGNGTNGFNTGDIAGGGGGGAANAGGGGSTNATGGAGGNGIAFSISGTSTTYGGGGGGRGYNSPGTAGNGGGGSGGAVNGANANAGTANTGGGGGGGGTGGGSGILIIRYE